ncbi:MAG: DEAD/DEAH box helicase [Fusobacterium gastrosuis]|uniref:DEAD/DEAH box helicase n=1 Tax=Fusobacterium TaxID=848 RepID=UPI001F4FF8C0|nr:MULTISPECIES: DEAD/DEAH box helicase [Fusobacterium]MDD7410723.1 DEAD/DEAH box helicase [Fusobacteriaceae bacterium]MCI5725415.1 DEAD/DEAH box helicase [Fusobacterium sp.]MCI7224039.1 DEAD/DEAH box helicase [Fusobacterium sp.]MDY4011941.1 DEAD/DEAH box helicase [Fusobacterium gastrosuis]MDY5305213.1 DEAD/DEAH box helicase [Fusobacterium gastrosuis]
MEQLEKLKEFRELGLSEKVLKVLSKKGYESPTPIQKLTIPALLNSEKDIIGQAQTGTGKTAAFALPIIETYEASSQIQAIVLTPTRELALQVAEEMNSLATSKKMKVIPVYGGQSIDIQRKLIKTGVDIVVGTPGRIIDLIERKLLKLQDLKYFVLDEADEMLNMGFIEDIEKILSYTNENKRMLFFSATMPEEIMKIAKQHMKEYEILAVKTRELTTDLTEQIYFEVAERDKFEALCRIIDLTKEFYGIVFCRTKTDVNEIVGRLNDRGYDAEGLHGDIGQNYREVTLKRFKSKKINILVATDVAARGIDINDLSHVINYAIPQEVESYVHRIGRTGRAGKEGTAITFITPQEYRRLLQIQKAVKKEIRKEKLPNIKDVIQAKKFRIIDDISQILIDNDYDNFKKLAAELLKMENAENIVAALLKSAYSDVLDESNYNEISPVKIEETGKTRLFIAMGRNEKITAKKLVDLIVKKAKIKQSSIKNAEVYESFSFVSVPFKEAELIIEAFSEDRKGKKPLIEKAKSNKK